MTTTPTYAPARYAGLDGLRAIAVTLVVIYHLFPSSWVRGGFIGVDVFFVISGFLITSLLLRPSARLGSRAGLVDFWRRRARRLLPALALLVAVCGTTAWLIGGDVLVRLGPQIAGSLTFSYNWVSVAGGTDYFTASTPELFRNLWSLAVEEQFYVLWPLLLPLVLLIRPLWGRVALVIALAAGSAAWMWGIVAGGGDLTRAYFGTDTHAFGILLGVALAFLVARMPQKEWMTTDAARRAVSVVGLLAAAGVVALALITPSDTTATFPGVLLAASLLSGLAIVAGVWPRSTFGRALDVAPLAWIGERSYGIYLWHWPVLILVVMAVQGTGPEAGVPLWVGAVVLGLTLVASSLSYRYLEQPVRRLGFRGSAAALGRRLGGTPATRFAAIALVFGGLIGVGGTTAAIAAAPAVTSAQAVIDAGAAALSEAPPAPSPVVVDDALDPQHPPAGAEPALVVAAPAPLPVTGDQITAVGDSVMLAAAPALLGTFPGIHVDAEVSRSMWAGPGILQGLAGGGMLRPYVVVALGTNGPVNAESLEALAATVGPDRTLVLVNAYAPRNWIEGVNADLAAFAASHPGVVIADWSAAIGPRTDLLAGDHIHPGSGGAQVFADTVRTTLDAVAAEQAEADYRQRLFTYINTLDIFPTAR